MNRYVWPVLLSTLFSLPTYATPAVDQPTKDDMRNESSVTVYGRHGNFALCPAPPLSGGVFHNRRMIIFVKCGEVTAKDSIPILLAACHTGVVNGYLVEGHVPAADSNRLLAEKPAAKAIAVPGMPIGSPGMEQGHRVMPTPCCCSRSMAKPPSLPNIELKPDEVQVPGSV